MARLIGRNERHARRYHLADESLMRVRVGAIDDLADNISFTGDSSDHFGFPCSTLAMRAMLALVLVLFFAAKENLIDLDLAHELFPLGILHRGPKSHALIPSRVIIVRVLRAVHHPVKL